MLDKLAMTAASAVLILSAGAAGAETLADAVALAYDSNPTLQQQRAQVRALDETYVQALTGYRPSLSISATGGYRRSDPGATASTRPCPPASRSTPAAA